MIRATWALGQLAAARTELEALAPNIGTSEDRGRIIRAIMRVRYVAEMLKLEQAAYTEEANDALFGKAD